MYQREFKQKLRQGFPKAVLFYGDNEYMIDFYIDVYIKQTQAKDSMLTMYYDEWDFAKAKGFLSQSSLFGGANLLLVRMDKKIPKKDLDVLIALANKNNDNYFLYAYAGESKNAKSMQSAFMEKKGGIWVRFFEPTIGEAVALLQQKAQQIGLDIDHYALQHLLLVLNNNLALCANELEKLAILNMKITSKDIDRLVYSTSSLATEDLLSALLSKKPIIETINKLLELGEDETSLLRSTQYFITQIFLFQAYIKLNGSVDSLAILGYKLPKQIENQKAQLAISIKSSALLKISEHLREVLLYGMLIKLQSYL